METSNSGIDELLDRLRLLLEEEPDVLFAFLFGSRATEKARANSDLDVAIYFRDPPAPALDRRLDLAARISDATGFEVDLSVLNNASPLLQHQVLKTGRKIFVRDRVAYIRFRDEEIRLYQDYIFLNGYQRYL